MTKIERAPEKLVLRSGSTTITLDKSAGKAVMQRKLLFWSRSPLERRISEIVEVKVGSAVDRASGVEICSIVLVMRAGDAWTLPAADRKDAEAAVANLRGFLGVPGA